MRQAMCVVKIWLGAELHAGGNWNNGSNCGPRCRNANNSRWNTNTNIGSRSCTRIQGAHEPNSLAGHLTMPGNRKSDEGQNTRRRVGMASRVTKVIPAKFL